VGGKEKSEGVPAPDGGGGRRADAEERKGKKETWTRVGGEAADAEKGEKRNVGHAWEGKRRTAGKGKKRNVGTFGG